METKRLDSRNMEFFILYNRRKGGIGFTYYLNVLSEKTSYEWEINKTLFT